MISAVVWILNALVVIVIADALLSWVMAPGKFPRTLTRQITQPLYAPIHAILNPAKMGIDISPIIVILVLQGIVNALARY